MLGRLSRLLLMSFVWMQGSFAEFDGLSFDGFLSQPVGLGFYSQ